jgi:hypothetical protein
MRHPVRPQPNRCPAHLPTARQPPRPIERIPVNGFTRGRNATARIDHETVAVFTKP